jgi:hypothetical protein
VKDPSSLLLRHWSSPIDLIKQLPVLTELHKDIDFILAFYDLVNLCDVFMHEVFLGLDLSLDCLGLLLLVLLHFHYLDSDDLAGGTVGGFLHLAESALSDRLFYFRAALLSS